MALTTIEIYLHIVSSSHYSTSLRRTSSLGLKMRPLRGRCVAAGGSAGRAKARCARPRATHGYFIDRSAVAEPTLRGRGLRHSVTSRSPIIVGLCGLRGPSGLCAL